MIDNPVVLTFPDRRAQLVAVPAEPDLFDQDAYSPADLTSIAVTQAVHAARASHDRIVFTSDIVGRLAHVDEAYYAYAGGPTIMASRTTLLPAVDPRDRDAAAADWSAAVDACGSFATDLRLIGADHVSRWFRWQSVPVWTNDGHIDGWSGVCVDIDDLKNEQAMLRANDTRLRRGMVKQRQANLKWREMQTGLAHAAKLSAVGHMATTLAHELNQPLTAAAMYAKAAARALGKQGGSFPPGAAQAADNAAEQVLRAGAIVRNLRDFVSTGECRRARESLRTLIEDAAAFALIGVEDLSVAVRFTLDETSHVFVNRIQIQQVLINLVRNAVEAMGDLHRRELDLTLHEEPNDLAMVCVADTGPGIAPDLVDRLFSPCVSAKSGGMGLGLSISREIVEAHGGRIWAEHAPNGGAVFKFTLPVIGHDHAV